MTGLGDMPPLNPALQPRATLTLITGDRTMVLETYDEAVAKITEKLDESGPDGWFAEFQTFRDFAPEIDKTDHEPFRRSIPVRYVTAVDEITDKLWERHQEAMRREASAPPAMGLRGFAIPLP